MSADAVLAAGLLTPTILDKIVAPQEISSLLTTQLLGAFVALFIVYIFLTQRILLWRFLLLLVISCMLIIQVAFIHTTNLERNVINYGDAFAAFRTPFILWLGPIFVAVTTCLIHIFYFHIIYICSRNRLRPLLVQVLLFTLVLLDIALFGVSMRMTINVGKTNSLVAYAPGAPAVYSYKNSGTATSAINTVTHSMIASLIFYLLSHNNTKAPNSTSPIWRIITLTFISGTLSTILAIVSLVLYRIDDLIFWGATVGLWIPYVNAICVLMLLMSSLVHQHGLNRAVSSKGFGFSPAQRRDDMASSGQFPSTAQALGSKGEHEVYEANTPLTPPRL